MNGQFNAIDYAQQLEAAGVTQAQAAVHAKSLSLALTNCAASRADLNALDEKLFVRLTAFDERIAARTDAFEARIAARLDKFEAKVDLKLESMFGEMKLLRWMAATSTAILIAALIKLFFP
jgi:hypothetical protein